MAPDLPKLVEGSFVPDALSLFISDKLFRVKMAQGSPAFIHVLTEHKSYPDRKVAWQITRGIMACTEQSIREMGKNWESLPAVIPVLIYHGNSPWNYHNDLISLVDANSAMHPWLLNVKYILVDLSTTEDSLLSLHARLRAGFLALKYFNSQSGRANGGPWADCRCATGCTRTSGAGDDLSNGNFHIIEERQPFTPFIKIIERKKGSGGLPPGFCF